MSAFLGTLVFLVFVGVVVLCWYTIGIITFYLLKVALIKSGNITNKEELKSFDLEYIPLRTWGPLFTLLILIAAFISHSMLLKALIEDKAKGTCFSLKSTKSLNQRINNYYSKYFEEKNEKDVETDSESAG